MGQYVDANGAIHSGQTGQFTGHAQVEADPGQAFGDPHDTQQSAAEQVARKAAARAGRVLRMDPLPYLRAGINTSTFNARDLARLVDSGVAIGMPRPNFAGRPEVTHPIACTDSRGRQVHFADVTVHDDGRLDVDRIEDERSRLQQMLDPRAAAARKAWDKLVQDMTGKPAGQGRGMGGFTTAG